MTYATKIQVTTRSTFAFSSSMAKNIAIIAANIKIQIQVLALAYDIIADIGISIRSSFTYNMGRVANEPVSPVENPTTS